MDLISAVLGAGQEILKIPGSNKKVG